MWFADLLVIWELANPGWPWLGGPSPPGTCEAWEYSFHGDGRGTREQAQLHRHFLSI